MVLTTELLLHRTQGPAKMKAKQPGLGDPRTRSVQEVLLEYTDLLCKSQGKQEFKVRASTLRYGSSGKRRKVQRKMCMRGKEWVSQSCGLRLVPKELLQVGLLCHQIQGATHGGPRKMTPIKDGDGLGVAFKSGVLPRFPSSLYLKHKDSKLTQPLPGLKYRRPEEHTGE